MKICCIPRSRNERDSYNCSRRSYGSYDFYISRKHEQRSNSLDNATGFNATNRNGPSTNEESVLSERRDGVGQDDKIPDPRDEAGGSTRRDTDEEFHSEEDAPPPILLPCAICARTFMPQSLEKHARICERAAAKKRKPFDSAKQRIQGTELAEFQPKQETRRHQDDRIARSSWKKNHDDFLRTIREARGELMDLRKPCNSSLITSGAPTRANEKGMCPTCNRHFGIKAYDRHVAWCRDRLPRVSMSPATNLAKERLEARMRYRAPALKNRRAINREKYSPGSSANMTAKTSLSSPALVKSKDTALTTNCSREKQKPAVVRHSEQLKESPTSSGPMKSRLADRDINRRAENRNPLVIPTSCQSSYAATSRRSFHHFPVPPATRPRIINDPVSSNEIASPDISFRGQSDRNERLSQHAQGDDARNREDRSAGTRRNNVSSRNQSYPRVNDTTVNDRTLGVTVHSCRMRADRQKDGRFVTWKQISRKKEDFRTNDSIVGHNSSRDFQLLDLELAAEDTSRTERDSLIGCKKDDFHMSDSIVGRNSSRDFQLLDLELAAEDRTEEDFLITDDDFTRIDNVEAKNNEIDKAYDATWPVDLPNQTYLIKDSGGIEDPVASRGKWRRSPRVEFYFKEREKNGIRELDEKQSDRKSAGRKCDEGVRVANNTVAEIKINIENKEEDNQVKIRHKIEVMQADNKNRENKQPTSSDGIEEHKMVKITDKDKDDQEEANNEDVADEHDVTEVDTNATNEESVRNLGSVNSETQKPQQTSEVGNSSSANNEFLRIEGNNKEHEGNFASVNFKNNTGQEKYFDTGSDECSNNHEESKVILGDSIVEAKVIEGSHRKTANSNSVCGNDDTSAGARNTRGDLESSVITLRNNVDASRRCCRDGISLRTSVNFPRASKRNGKSADERPPENSVEIKHRIRETADRGFRGSTDSSVSSVELTELAGLRRSEAECAYEIETIEIIGPGRVSVKGLPGVRRSESAETRGDSERSYWERASRISRSKLIGPARHSGYKLPKRNTGTCVLPPVLISSLINGRKIELATRPVWCNYVRRRPDFNYMLKARTGTCKDYNPFLLAEQQMNDLLSDTSDQSATGSPKSRPTRDTLYPLSHSSAFVKYPPSEKRTSLIAPPTEFDDLSSTMSSDSTETNSISREIFLKPDSVTNATNLAAPRPVKELSRRIIIDKSKALGVDERRNVVGSADHRKTVDKIAPKVTRLSRINRSNPIRASSAPRTNNAGPDGRKITGGSRKSRDAKTAESQRSSDRRNNNYSSLSGSTLSLGSIVSSSDADVKRSTSMFDELMTSFEEDMFPDLRSLLNNESFDLSSPMHDGDRQRNGSVISDEELSLSESYRPQDHCKLSNDSAYSSLNRKYSHHGRSAHDMAGRLDEDAPRNGVSPIQYKMSKFCHECGQRFPETAKFCCECGVRRLAL